MEKVNIQDKQEQWPGLNPALVQVDKLIPYANNSRTHSDAQIDQIAASINEWGFTNPVLVDEKNTIIAGHGRLLAARKLGIKEVPCIIAEGWTDAQKKAYVIADNKLALNAGWDDEMLALEIGELEGMDFELSLLGFDDAEMAALMQDTTEGLTDEDAVPDVPEQPVTILGDIWMLGEHRLMCGDSTDAGSVALLMDGQKADQLVTDPPYNVDYTGKTKKALKIQGDSMGDAPFRQFLTDAFTNAYSVMKAGASYYIWHADLEGYNFRGACKDSGLEVRQCLVWNKDTMVMGRQDYHWKHEPCLYGWKEGSGHLWASDRKQTTIITCKRPSKSELHPTMKPVELMEYQIKNNTKGEDIVLDLFGGSGSTLLACEKTNRHCRMMELDPKYCDVIINRWQDFTGKKATMAGDTFDDVAAARGVKING